MQPLFFYLSDSGDESREAIKVNCFDIGLHFAGAFKQLLLEPGGSSFHFLQLIGEVDQRCIHSNSQFRNSQMCDASITKKESRFAMDESIQEKAISNSRFDIPNSDVRAGEPPSLTS